MHFNSNRFLSLGIVAMSLSLFAADPQRNDWYWDSVVNLHMDNHSGLMGKGYSVDQLTEMIKDLPVPMIQVSAFGAVGMTTYPTKICPHPQLGDWDTLAVWRQVARNSGKRFCVYINTRGLGLPKKHPEWMQRDSRGKGKGKNDGFDVCARPSADGDGVLETVFLPMLYEIVSRYRPDGIWVDGDHARTQTCYCGNCAAAWKAKTGKDEPPKGPDDPDWSAWLELEQQRVDAYRKQMADVIYSVHDGCMYTSNHSWRFRSKDPRTAPDFADTLSGDLSHGPALRYTRLSGMQLSAEEKTPYDIMHNIKSISRQEAALRRILQQGALTFASGGAWFLWVPGSTIVRKPIQDTAKACAEFAMARRAALGKSTSLNQTAVLLSETSWRRERIGGEQGYYDPEAAENAALALQDACYCVDIVNEGTLRARIDAYRTVLVANQRSVAPKTLSVLRKFADAGGLLIVTGAGLRDESKLLGLSREGQTEGIHRIELEDATAVFSSVQDVRITTAEVLARFADGKPFLTRNRVGKGACAYLGIPSVAYPDDDGVLAWVMKTVGNGPAVHVEGAARDEHLVFALRRKPGKAILHISNLTSRVNARRAVPTTQNNIDADPPLRQVKLAMPLSARPKGVNVLPADTTARHRWDGGVLHLTLENVNVHAAVILDAEPQLPLAYMSAATPTAKRHVLGDFSAEDFESLSPRNPVPESVGLCRVGGETSIRVTCKTAASGSRCLKFVDRADAPKPFLPYFILRPRGLNRDIGYFSFDLKLGKDAAAQIELREIENAREFPVGPSLKFMGDGKLMAAGRAKPLASVPMDRWIHSDVIFPLDGGGRYDLKLRIAGEAERVFTDLPYRNQGFWRCGWVGIIGMGQSDAAFYVDNLNIGRIKKKADFETQVASRLPAIKEGITARESPIEAKGLLAHWRFDEGAGNTAFDVSGKANHGDVAAKWVKGDFGRALHFSGKRGANVLVEDCDALRFGKSDFTIECWVCPHDLKSPKNYRRLLEKNDYPRAWWNVDIQSDGKVQMEMADENKETGTTLSAGAIRTDGWTHLAIVVDRSDFKTSYYFDGMLDSGKPVPRVFSGGLDVSGSDLYIGASHMPFVGLIDELRAHGRALTGEEIATRYEREKAGRSGTDYVPLGK